MPKYILLFLFFGLTFKSYSQVSSLKGNVSDENRTAVGFAPVVLLNPADSTMAYFAVTNDQGVFEIRGVKNGKYLFQVAFIGHQTVYRAVTIPQASGDDMGTIVMKSKPVSLGEVIVADERVPIRLKQDTIEYNTAAFKTKPDAVVEDLLRKLPGIDVDRAGNIKAMGEDIKKVLVDGKEFFGSDPKLATRNVPADALRKIQVYDKKSDEAEFTGIDDGTRDKTLNLLLKEDRKNAIFGEVLGGGGSQKYYEGSGKIYKFSKKNQFAALGMANNINQFGFSFRDYIDFSGGIQSLGGNGGAVQIRLPDGGGNSFPVNFGQPVNGLSTSGAGGLNFSHEYKKDSRIFMSYIANGSDRDLLQSTATRNFTDLNSFKQEDNLDENKLDLAHRLNFGLRDRIDSTQNLIVNGTASMSYDKSGSNLNSSLFDSETEKSLLSTQRNGNARQIQGNVSGSYLKLINKGKTVFRLASDASWSQNLAKSDWTNITYDYDPVSVITGSQFQHNSTRLSDLSVTTSVTQKIVKAFYIEPELSAGAESEALNRKQGIPVPFNEAIDSLSPEFVRHYQWLRPGLSLIRNTEKVQFTLVLKMQLDRISNSLNGDNPTDKNQVFFTPRLSWEYEYKTGRRLRMYYETRINVPTISQLLPVTDVSNPLALSTGNRYLKPEVDNSLSMNWLIFDQFSFTSFITGINATYTQDKINWDRKIDQNLMQSMSLINVPYDYRIQGSSDFSTPIRKLGIKISTNLQETWNKGLSYVNGLENTNTNWTHKASLSVENRTKTKWDITVGGSIQMTDARFSIQESLNNRYLDFSYFTETHYTPNKNWNFQFTTDVTNYNSRSFSKAVSIPLLGAEASYYFLKNKRGALTMQGVDLLNRNTGIERTSDLNFLRERRSNMLGRFFMLSFKYRLNKFGETPGGIDIKIRKT